MPDRIRLVWRKIRQPFAQAAANFRRMAENSVPFRMIASDPLGKRFLTDTVFRSGVMLYVSLIVNFAYGAVQFLVGVYSQSVWLGILAVYHVLLGMMQDI